MTFNKKLLVAGLVAGTTAILVYELSKKKEKELKQQAAAAATAASASTPAAALSQPHYHEHFPASAADFNWDDLRHPNFIAKLLSDCVMDQFLYSFYTFQEVQAIAQRIASSGALSAVADAWQLPPSLAADLVKLSLFDVFFLLDDSASMQSEGRRRRDGLRSIVQLAAEAATRFDTDGVELNWLNSRDHAVVHRAEEATCFVDASRYDGRATPMGHALEEKILEREVYLRLKRDSLRKPVLIIVVGDGRPTGESPDKFRREIKEAKKKAKKSKYGEDAVSFTVAVVGNDRDAHEWLEELDSDRDVGDLVDVCSDIKVESQQVKRTTGIELTPSLYSLKIVMGSIDSSYDSSDETHSYKAASKRREEREKKEREYASLRARFVRDRDAALGSYLASSSTGGFANTAAIGTQANAYAQGQGHQYGQYQAPPQQGGYGSQPYGGAPSGYPPQHYQQGPPGSAPYLPGPQAGGYPPSGGGYPPPPGGGGYPPVGAPGGYPPPVSSYGSGGGGYPPPGPPGAGAPYPPPSYDARGVEGPPGEGMPGFTSGVGGFMMPSANVGGQGGGGGHGGPPGFPSGPSYPSAPYS